jgi:polysaccharide export outer membrane protein
VPEANDNRYNTPNLVSTSSSRGLWRVLLRRRRFVGWVVGGMLLACLLYCAIAPNQYEATARVSLRQAPASALSLEAAEPMVAASILSAPLQLETLANVLRSDRLAWRVIAQLKLYQQPGFLGLFSARHLAGFRPDASTPEAQDYLLERFARRLHVQTVPRTLVLEISFRSKDAALSAEVVNALVRAYGEQENESRMQATVEASAWMQSQLTGLKARFEQDQQQLMEFQNTHGILSTPDTLANGEPGQAQHTSALLEIDELGRQLVAASTDRILREAEYRAASQGNPEMVVASDPRLQAEVGHISNLLIEQIRARQSELEQEQAQLSIEHGPNFPRVVEIRRLLQDLDRQKLAEDAKLVASFESAWKAAADREQLVRASLEQRTTEARKLNEAAIQYEVMRQEANASHEVFMRVAGKVEEAGLAAGIHGSNISVVDDARQPVKPVAPDLPLYMAITLFAGLWLAVGGAFLMESIRPSNSAVALLALLLACAAVHAQAPTPTTSGLPSGVAHPSTTTPEAQTPPNPLTAPTIWDSPQSASQANGNQAGMPTAGALSSAPMPAPLAPGDSLDITEFHTPEFHSLVRVSPAGTVTLPMIGELQLAGLDEQGAARAIEAALVAQGMLLHPRVSVLITAYVGQDVSVLGEVARPGVYPYTLHHRLLDLISAASGLAPNAGRLVNIFHRADPNTPHPVVLDPSGTDTAQDHNPELAPGDTVQVSRAGLVYVVGDVLRPGGFPVDPAQGLTVLQALSQAWGASPNAATGKALLIREQKGGRTITSLNLKRMIHGQEPDQPVHDRDILFVPDSTAKNLWNKSLESAIQSAIGITIYAGLVYSQRF